MSRIRPWRKQLGYLGIGNRRGMNGGQSWEQYIAALLSGAPVQIPLTHTAVPTRGSIVPTFTRATTSTWQNNDGYMVTGVAGEIGFPGARRVRNLLSATSAMSALPWAQAVTGASTVIATAGQSDPWGGTLATKLVFSASGAGEVIAWRQAISVTQANQHTSSIRIRADAPVTMYLRRGASSAFGALAVTTEWQDLEVLVGTAASTTLNFDLTTKADAFTGTAAAVTVYVVGAQLEDVTAQTTQTAGEYVSVGALDYRSELNRLYLSLPGTAGHYASTPDSVAASITGDLSIRAYVAASDWTPTADVIVVSKWLSAGGAGTRSYILLIDATTGKPHLYTSADGASVYSLAMIASAAPTISDGAGLWLYVTFDVDNGSGGSTTKFYTSTDGVSYTQLGADVVIAGVTSIADTATILTLGSSANGSTSNFAGRIGQVQLYADLVGTTPVLDFNPHRDATTPTGTFTSSTTGEVWTINGASSVVRSDYYHGSGVDGVKCFDTDLSGNPIPTSYTYDAVTLNGVAGTYVSTPDSVAASITGDIDIRVKAAITTPTTTSQWFVSKIATNGQSAYDFGIQLADTLAFRYTATGLFAGIATATCSTTTGVTAGATSWYRVTYTSATGKVNFYTSSDGSTWSPRGTEQTITAGAIFNGTDALTIATSTGTTSGKVYEAQIYNGIRESGGTLAVDFDASRYVPATSATTLTGSTGETWTLNGSAIIRPNNYPLKKYKPELAATNVCLQSNAFTTTWSASGTPAATQNVVGPDGATSAWTLTDDDAGVLEGVYIANTLTAATYTASVFVKKTVGAQSSYPGIYLQTGTTIAPVVVDTTNGIATAFSAYTGNTIAGGLTARCTSFNADYWRVEITFTGTVAAWNYLLAPAATTNATQSTGSFAVNVTGSAVFYGAQVELGSAATSYIPTTTTALARNADVLTYTGGDIPNLKTLLCDFERASGVSSAGHICTLTDGTANNTAQTYLNTATQHGMAGVTGGVVQWGGNSSNAYTPATRGKNAISVATNDAKSSFNGVGQAADASVTVPVVTQMCVGHFNTSLQLNGNVGGIYGWTRNLSQSELNAVSKL